MPDTAGDKINAVIAALETLQQSIEHSKERGLPILESHLTTIGSLKADALEAQTLYLAEQTP